MPEISVAVRRILAGGSCIAMAAAFSGVAAHAQGTAAPDQGLTGGDDIVVTAAGYEQRVEQAPASISVMAREEIETIRAVSIPEILADMEGVDVGDSVGKTGGATISIRGMGSDQTLILIDGRRQNTAGSVTPNGFNETANSFLPPVSAIERIEVVRGPVATLYGSDAMGGVVNIITRKVSDRWTGSATGHYTYQGDRDFGDIYGGNLYLNGPLVPDLLGVAVRGSYSQRDRSALQYLNQNGTPVPVTGFGPNPTRNKIWSAGGRLSMTPHADHDLWLDVDFGDQWYDNSSGQMGTNTIAGGYADELEFKRQQYVLAHNWRSPIGVLESTLSRNETETLGRLIPALVPGKGGLPRTLQSTSTIFDTKLASQIANHMFTIGGQYWDAEMVDGVASAPFTFEQWAIFAEDEWRPVETFAITVGGRYDHHSTFGSHFSPRGYIVWNATDNWTIKGGVSKGYKAPRLEQLAPGINGFGSQGRLPLIGTPTLTPETSIASELAVFYDNRDNFRASITLFRNDFRDKISSSDDPVDNCAFGVSAADYEAGNYSRTGCVDVGFYPAVATFGQSVNIDKARAQGVETTLRFKPVQALTLTANYTYTESEQQSGPSIGNPLTNTPRHMINGQARWSVSTALNLWLRGEYRSPRFRPADSGSGNAKALYGDYRAYAVFHLGGSYRLNDALTINATVYNLLDKNFVDYQPALQSSGAPTFVNRFINNQEPRRLWLSVKADF